VRVEALVWLLIPVAAFVVALIWLKVANRTRPPAGTEDTVDAHDRFRQAMERDTPPARPPASPTAEPGPPSADEGR
jgi:hypothetical protein